MRKYFYDLESAIKFAKDNGTRLPEVSKWGKESMRKLEMFNIDGYSRVVPAFTFGEYVYAGTNEKYFSYDGCTYVIQIVETGECFCARDKHNNTGKYWLYMLNPQYHKRDSGFEFEEQEPNCIGKANQKKVQQWVDYLHRKETARIEYANKALKANIEFANKFKAKYPTGRFNTCVDGWTSEFRIEVGFLRFNYIAYEDGRFGRDVDFVYSALPSDEDLLK